MSPCRTFTNLLPAPDVGPERTAVALMACHLRDEHGMSWTKIASRLGVNVREVREMVRDTS